MAVSPAPNRLPVVLMRGGTSKGVFVPGDLLPPGGPELDSILLDLMGSPDPMQIDGLGGTHSSTSKVVLVYPTERSGCDVEYLFAQVGIDTSIVDYAGNCGNLTSAVGPYAIDEGLVEVADDATDADVVLFNRNTNVRIRAFVPVSAGRFRSTGDTVVAGVRRPGAAIVTEYLDPAGAVCGSALPTGRATDKVTWDRTTIDVSILDVAGPVAFVCAADLGLDEAVSPAAVNADQDLLDRIEQLRGQCAVLIGSATTSGRARIESAALPRLAIVAAPHADEADGFDIVARVMSMQRMHHAVPITVLLGIAGAAGLAGTIPSLVATPGTDGFVRVAHPRGVAVAGVSVGAGGAIESVSVTRTARRLLDGWAYLPERP